MAAMSGIVYYVVLLFELLGVLQLILAIVVGALVYFIVIYLLKGISRQEIVCNKTIW